MKFLTIRQPWASLIAVGAKTIETRPFSTKYRGPLAIHAGLAWPKMMTLPALALTYDGSWEERDEANGRTWHVCNTIVDPAYHGPQPCNPVTGRQRRIPKAAQAPTLFWPHRGRWHKQGKPVERPYKGQASHHPHTEPLPLGAVVAVCDLIDVVPMIDGHDLSGAPTRWTGDGWLRLTHYDLRQERELMLMRGDAPAPGSPDVSDQLPFGDFTPNRWAWLIDSVRPLPSPVPMRGAQGLRDLPADVAEAITRALTEGDTP
jgi:hypothetical protein